MSTCGYVQAYHNVNNKSNSYVYQWHVGNRNNYKGPQIGAETKDGFVFAAEYDAGEAFMGGRADLVSPKINSVYSSCYFTFYYQFKGTPTLSVLARINDQEDIELWDRIILDELEAEFQAYTRVLIFLR